MKKFLTEKNKRILKAGLKKYLAEVLEGEEYLTSIKDVYDDAIRVECWGSHSISVDRIRDYLQGLPLGTQYITYYIVVMLCAMVKITKDDFDKNYSEDATDLDGYYWTTLAEIIFEGGRK